MVPAVACPGVATLIRLVIYISFHTVCNGVIQLLFYCLLYCSVICCCFLCSPYSSVFLTINLMQTTLILHQQDAEVVWECKHLSSWHHNMYNPPLPPVCMAIQTLR